MKSFRDTVAAEMETKKAQRMGSVYPIHVLAMGVDLERGGMCGAKTPKSFTPYDKADPTLPLHSHKKK